MNSISPTLADAKEIALRSYRNKIDVTAMAVYSRWPEEGVLRVELFKLATMAGVSFEEVSKDLKDAKVKRYGMRNDFRW